VDNTYEWFTRDGYYITYRGPAFGPSYYRYELYLDFAVPVTIIAPRREAAGRPWVLHAGYVERDAKVDQALLARGFHIVVGPVGFNADGPSEADWDNLYRYLTEHGFSRKPVMQGAGGAAGAAYAWAIDNPDKVSCIYAENPILHTGGVEKQPIDNLAPLANAGVPLLHVCGTMDPAVSGQTLEAEKHYKQLGGNLTVIMDEGKGHYPTSPRNVRPIVDFIVGHQPANAAGG